MVFQIDPKTQIELEYLGNDYSLMLTEAYYLKKPRFHPINRFTNGLDVQQFFLTLQIVFFFIIRSVTRPNICIHIFMFPVRVEVPLILITESVREADATTM